MDPADIDERLVEQRAAIRHACEAAELLAREKALVVSARHPARSCWAPTRRWRSASAGSRKPTSRETAREQLALLRHRTHELHSAIAIARDKLVLFAHREVARLAMREFSEAFLEAYLDSVGNAATASVGGYQLEKSESSSSTASRATISSFSDFRFWRCCNFCVGEGLLMA